MRVSVRSSKSVQLGVFLRLVNRGPFVACLWLLGGWTVVWFSVGLAIGLIRAACTVTVGTWSAGLVVGAVARGVFGLPTPGPDVLAAALVRLRVPTRPMGDGSIELEILLWGLFLAVRFSNAFEQGGPFTPEEFT